MPIPAPSLPASVLERSIELDSQSQPFLRKLRQIQDPKVEPEPGCAAEKLREESLYCFCYGQFFNSHILSGFNPFFFVLFFS